jgi:hypothetical protein
MDDALGYVFAVLILMLQVAVIWLMFNAYQWLLRKNK